MRPVHKAVAAAYVPFCAPNIVLNVVFWQCCCKRIGSSRILPVLSDGNQLNLLCVIIEDCNFGMTDWMYHERLRSYAA
ncbi:hypothetical protein C6830_06205 [Neisseria gonorrhoeae]|nr:hypothetical protein EGH16_02715 [Neisseria gonorrhoeae]ROU33459.1 hypothetical protein EGO68_01140 [Neisseria gonorrhoeae]ROU42502.1 hypothetical protein EGO63_01155 [Neisseria gonorrhoeae]ROU69061.1 hypothetical protein EGO65_01145 [Neisseria gonorrhoeae]ROV19927.1 hypothetical protein EGP31_01145 [Neisseria gonorrhoeae]